MVKKFESVTKRKLPVLFLMVKEVAYNTEIYTISLTDLDKRTIKGAMDMDFLNYRSFFIPGTVLLLQNVNTFFQIIN